MENFFRFHKAWSVQVLKFRFENLSFCPLESLRLQGTTHLPEKKKKKDFITQIHNTNQNDLMEQHEI